MQYGRLAESNSFVDASVLKKYEPCLDCANLITKVDYGLTDINKKLCKIDCIFDEEVEIIKLIEIQENDCVQIVNKNYDKNIITVLTWDFVTNSEKNCYQINPDLRSDIE